MNQLLQGDCLELMATLPDNSVGMVLADLPYGVTACHWDKVIDLDAMWVQLKRLIQPKRALVFTATQPFTTDLICNNREWFKYCWVWEKTVGNNFLNAKREPLAKHEDVLVFGSAGWLHYDPQKQPGQPYTDKPRKRSHALIRDSKIPKLGIVNNGDRYPGSVLRIAHGNNNAIHPTQKPVALFEYLIRTYTNPGDVVLDPTAGSMTTAIAAMNTGRGYICIEKDADEYRKGVNRVEEHLAKPQQFNLLEPTPELPPVVTMHQSSLFG